MLQVWAFTSADDLHNANYYSSYLRYLLHNLWFMSEDNQTIPQPDTSNLKLNPLDVLATLTCLYTFVIANNVCSLPTMRLGPAHIIELLLL